MISFIISFVSTLLNTGKWLFLFYYFRYVCLHLQSREFFFSGILTNLKSKSSFFTLIMWWWKNNLNWKKIKKKLITISNLYKKFYILINSQKMSQLSNKNYYIWSLNSTQTQVNFSRSSNTSKMMKLSKFLFLTQLTMKFYYASNC